MEEANALAASADSLAQKLEETKEIVRMKEEVAEVDGDAAMTVSVIITRLGNYFNYGNFNRPCPKPIKLRIRPEQPLQRSNKQRKNWRKLLPFWPLFRSQVMRS